jgi:hypothetical protein
MAMNTTRRQVLLTPVACLLVTSEAAAAGWEKIDDSDGVKVYRKEVPGSPLVAFKGETVISAPIEKLLWVLADNDHRTEWVDRLEKSIVLERNGEYEYVVYQHFDLPFPISDRDYVFRGRAERSKSGAVILHLHSVRHPKAPATAGVRAELIRSKYVLEPDFGGKGKTKITVEIHTDPKGLIPNWLVNMIQKSWPMKTLVSMRKQVTKPYVKRLELPKV